MNQIIAGILAFSGYIILAIIGGIVGFQLTIALGTL